MKDARRGQKMLPFPFVSHKSSSPQQSKSGAPWKLPATKYNEISIVLEFVDVTGMRWRENWHNADQLHRIG